MRINLNCPYDDRFDAKRAGARWDPARKTWYVENMEDLTAVVKWIPNRLMQPSSQRPTHPPAGRITLATFLRGTYGSKTLALSHAAAKAFGVPYPLRSGWADTYAAATITEDQARKLCQKSIKKRKHDKENPFDRKDQPHANITAKSTDTKDHKFWASTGPTVFKPMCDCKVAPWDDCAHTDALAEHAMREMLGAVPA